MRRWRERVLPGPVFRDVGSARVEALAGVVALAVTAPAGALR
jgi:hypothetical protein